MIGLLVTSISFIGILTRVVCQEVDEDELGKKELDTINLIEYEL